LAARRELQSESERVKQYYQKEKEDFEAGGERAVKAQDAVERRRERAAERRKEALELTRASNEPEVARIAGFSPKNKLFMLSI